MLGRSPWGARGMGKGVPDKNLLHAVGGRCLGAGLPGRRGRGAAAEVWSWRDDFGEGASAGRFRSHALQEARRDRRRELPPPPSRAALGGLRLQEAGVGAAARGRGSGRAQVRDAEPESKGRKGPGGAPVRGEPIVGGVPLAGGARAHSDPHPAGSQAPRPSPTEWPRARALSPPTSPHWLPGAGASSDWSVSERPRPLPDTEPGGAGTHLASKRSGPRNPGAGSLPGRLPPREPPPRPRGTAESRSAAAIVN